jgi:hypothetical protein
MPLSFSSGFDPIGGLGGGPGAFGVPVGPVPVFAAGRGPGVGRPGGAAGRTGGWFGETAGSGGGVLLTAGGAPRGAGGGGCPGVE